MNIDSMNRLRRMAGLPDLTKEQRITLEEKSNTNAEKQMLTEAANNRAPAKVIADIAKQHLHVRSLEKTGDDGKDYHDCPCWAIEAALKAAFKAGQEHAPKKAVKESADKESEEESKKGGSKPPFDKKGGEKQPKDGEDKVEKKDVKERADYIDKPDEKEKFRKEKKKGKSFAQAAKAAKKEGNDNIKEMMGGEYDPPIGREADMEDELALGDEMNEPMCPPSEEEEEYTSSYKKGDHVMCKGKVCIVHIPDAKADYVGVIPVSMRDASEKQKDQAVDLVRKGQLNPASDEDCEMAYGQEEMAVYGSGGKAGTMEGSSEGYNNPKGTTLKADPKSGANAKKGDCYKDKHHKDDSMKAKSEDKGTKGLKHIKEAEDATVWGKDYGRDDKRIDKNESPDQLAACDPNDEAKVSVPAEYKRALRETISSLRKESDNVRVRDPHGSEFYEHTADAFENLLGHLEEGTRRALMLAQIDLNRVMSPMVQRLPNEVYMYIVRGGKPAALTELFKEVKVKKDRGADLSKEDYTS